MDAILNSIISIEKKAQGVVDSASADKEQMLADAKRGCGRLEEDIAQRAEARLAKVAQREQDFADSRIAAIQKEFAKKSEALEAQYAQNKERWVEEIYRSVIG